ncbi:LapA family protein [Geoalkalibacter sp.]|uniref:LapA family protein n=1 Tax=Geoalkalibacter sp. TaxID=3041440 RepID=UPI00272ECB35|nr:LapA family protein [Geoalkalibacter sp.]
MKQLKLLAATILALALVVVIVQNAAPVEVRILFFSFTLPQAVLLFIVGAGGFMLGILAALLLRKRGAAAPPGSSAGHGG